MPKMMKSDWDNLLKRLSSNDVTLTSLDLFGREIGAVGVKALSDALKVNNNLALLKLGCNGIGDAGIQDLSEGLKVNRGLTSLDLSGNPIGDIGAKYLSQALKENQILTELRLNYTEIKEAGMKELSISIKENYSLIFIELLETDKTGIDKNIKGLLRLGIPGSKKEIETYINRNRNLCNQLHQAVCQGNLPLTKQLLTQGVSFLSQNKVGSMIIKKFGNEWNTPLQWAVINEHEGLVDWLLEEMHRRGIPINRVNSSGYNVTAADMAANNPTLLTLFQPYLAISSNGKDRSDVNDNNQSFSSTEAPLTSKVPELKMFGSLCFLDKVRDNSDSDLTLFLEELGPVGAKEVSEALLTNYSITTLNLYDNQIGDAGVKELCKAFRINHTLTSIYLHKNQIGNVGAGDLGFILKNNRSIRLLSLVCNQIGDAGVRELSNALKYNRSLVSLSLSENEIGDEGVKDLSLALKENRILTDLNLSGNRIGAAGMANLSLVLRDNYSLTSIDLSFGNQRGAEIKKEIEVVKSFVGLGTGVSKKEIKAFIERNCQLRDQLHQAICQGDLNSVKSLVSQGVSFLSVTGNDNNTPLHWAVIKGHQHLVAWLIEEMQHQDISLDSPNRNKKTAGQLDADEPKLFSFFPIPISQPTNSQKVSNPIFTSSLDSNNNEQQSKNLSASSSVPSLQMENKEKIDEEDDLKISFKIASKDLNRTKLLGKGGFGTVYLAQYYNADVAVKQLHEQFFPHALEEFQQEARLMANLQYPYIVRLFGITDGVPHCIVMEYLPKGDLYKLLHSEQKLSWQQCLKIALDVTCGLGYLHQREIFHRDIKSLNVLLANDLTAKLSDFGFAKIKTESSLRSAHQGIGTTRWMAPEIMNAQKFTAKADVYSLGVVLWELSAREVPFVNAANDAIIINWVSNGKRDKIPANTPKQFTVLIENCWSQRPEDRPETSQIIHALQELLEGSFTNDNVPEASSPGPVYNENIDSSTSSHATQTSNSMPGNPTYLSSLTSNQVPASQQLHRNSSSQPLSQATSFTASTAEMNTPVQLARQLGFHAQSTRGASRIQQGMSNNNNSVNEGDNFSVGRSSKAQ